MVYQGSAGSPTLRSDAFISHILGHASLEAIRRPLGQRKSSAKLSNLTCKFKKKIESLNFE